MKKYGCKFRRDYTIKVIPTKSNTLKFGRISTRKQKGGSKLEEGRYLNPLKIKERLDDTTIRLEDDRIVTVHRGITYLSCGTLPEKEDPIQEQKMERSSEQNTTPRLKNKGLEDYL